MLLYNTLETKSLYLNRTLILIYLPSTMKLQRLCFTGMCLSTGGRSASVHAGMPPPQTRHHTPLTRYTTTTPLDQTPPQTRHHHPGPDTPPGADTPLEQPPAADTPRERHKEKLSSASSGPRSIASSIRFFVQRKRNEISVMDVT